MTSVAPSVRTTMTAARSARSRRAADSFHLFRFSLIVRGCRSLAVHLVTHFFSQSQPCEFWRLLVGASKRRAPQDPEPRPSEAESGACYLRLKASQKAAPVPLSR